MKMERLFGDGSRWEGELIERVIGGQRRFEKVGTRAGEYYVINNEGNLDIYDRDGHITTAVKKPVR